MINLNLNVTKLVEEAKGSISDFCINKCKADCCKNRIVPCRSESNIRVLLGLNNNADLEEFSFMYPKKLKKTETGLYFVYQPCANLEKDRCNIYHESKRPPHCKDYPIVASYDKDGFPFVEYTSECKAVQKGLFNRVLDVLRNNYVFVLCAH